MKNLLRSYTFRVLLPLARNYSTVDKNTLSQLRKRTGISFINCKKALEKFNNDLDEAEKWLLEQAQKEGWAKAMKLESRPMSQGLLGLVNQANSITMVEVNCETDFVAKNEKFQSLVSRLTLACHDYFSNSKTGMTSLDKTDVNAITTTEGKSLSDLVALEVGTLGENMILRRAVCIKPEDGSILGTYLHSSGKKLSIDGCSMAKFGAVVEISRTNDNTESEMSLTEISSQLCQHIVGMNPKIIGEPYQKIESENDDDNDESEDQSSDDSDSESDGESSDDSDSDSETETAPRKDEKVESRLLYQDFLLNENMKVGDYLQDNGVSIKNFVRFECGEEL